MAFFTRRSGSVMKIKLGSCVDNKPAYESAAYSEGDQVVANQ